MGIGEIIFNTLLPSLFSARPAPAATTEEKVDTYPEFADDLETVKDFYQSLFGKKMDIGFIILNWSWSQDTDKPYVKDRAAVSESVGFGGLIYSSSDSKESQNAYWKLYKARKEYFLKDNGVMAWQVGTNGRKKGKASASDADQDWMYSSQLVLQLLIDEKWDISLPTEAGIRNFSIGEFKAEIQKDLDAFWLRHVKKVNGRLIFLVADSGSWIKNVQRKAKSKTGKEFEVYYPNYVDPHFLRTLAKFDKSHDWTKLANDSQDINQAILLKELGNYSFVEGELKKEGSIKDLCQAVNNDAYGITFKAPDNTIGRLNELLETTAFYDLWIKKGKSIPSKEKELKGKIKKLAEDTAKYRNKNFDELSDFEKIWIKRLNRLLLEATYPQLCPKNQEILDLSKEDFVPRKIGGKKANKRKLGAAGQNPMPAKTLVHVIDQKNFEIQNCYEISGNYDDNEYDSIRFLLRQARAAILDNDEKAKEILKYLLPLAHIDETNPRSASIDVSHKSNRWGHNSTLVRASYGIALLALGSRDSQSQHGFLRSVLYNFQWQPPEKGTREAAFFGESTISRHLYYDQSLILQILDLLASEKGRALSGKLFLTRSDTTVLKAPPQQEVFNFRAAKDYQEMEVTSNANILLSEKAAISWLISQQREGSRADYPQAKPENLLGAIAHWQDPDNYELTPTRYFMEIPEDTYDLGPDEITSAQLGEILRPTPTVRSHSSSRKPDKWYSRAYWRAKIALILINDIEQPDHALIILDDLLRKIPFSLPKGILDEIKFERDEHKEALLESLRKEGLLKKAQNPLMWGEYYFQKALIAKNRGEDAAALFAKATTLFNAVINNQVLSPQEAAAAGFSPQEAENLPIYSIMRTLIRYCGGESKHGSRPKAKISAKNIYSTENLPAALMYQAQITLITAEDDEEALLEARPLLLKARRNARGLLSPETFKEFEDQQTYVWNKLISLGCINKKGEIIALPRKNDFLKALEGETSLSLIQKTQLYYQLRKDRQVQRQVLRQAFALIEIERFLAEIQIRTQENDGKTALATMQKIVAWGDAYLKDIKTRNETRKPKEQMEPSPWAKQIIGSSNYWLAKAETLRASKIKPQERVALFEKAVAHLNTATEYLIGELHTDAYTAWLEARAQLVFARKDMGIAGWQAELEQVKQDFIGFEEKVKTHNQLIPAQLNLWIGTIILVEADTKTTLKEKNKTLKAAEPYIKGAKKPYIKGAIKLAKEIKLESKWVSKNRLIASAHKTLGDILAAQKDFKGAKEEYEKSIVIAQEIRDRNKAKRTSTKAQKLEDIKYNLSILETQAALADLLNWTGQYKPALDKYQEALKLYDPSTKDADILRYKNVSHDSAYHKTVLGLAEATFRQTQGDYTGIKAYALGIIKEILTREAPAGILVERALGFLLEGYLTKRMWQDHVVFLANHILGTEYEMLKAEPKEPFQALVKIIDPQALSKKTKAKVYLALVRALTTQKRFDDAEEALKKAGKVPAVDTYDILQAEYKLVKAIRALRQLQEEREKEIPEETYDLIKEAVNTVFSSKELKRESSLVVEAAALLIEAFMLEKKYDEAIKLVRHFLGEVSDRTISLAFSNEGEKSNLAVLFLNKQEKDLFRFNLELYRIDSLMGDKQFAAALKLLNEKYGPVMGELGLTVAAEPGTEETTLKELGDATAQIKQLDPLSNQKKAVISKLVQLWLRFGELYRYGKKLGGENLKDLDRSPIYYRAIIHLATEKKVPHTDKMRETLARTYLGLANVEIETMHSIEALEYLNIILSGSHLEYLFKNLREEAKRLHTALSRPIMSSESKLYVGKERKHGETWTEFQENILLTLFATENNRMAIYLRNQFDFADNIFRYNPYLGISGKPWNWLTLQLEHKIPIPSAGDGVFKHLRDYDLILSLGIWSRYVDFLVSSSFYYTASELNTYYAKLSVKPLDWLHLDAEASYYTFTLPSASRRKPGANPHQVEYEQITPRRVSLPLTTRFPVDIGMFDSDFGYNRLKLEIFGGPVFNFLVDPKEQEEMRNVLPFDWGYVGGRFGGGLSYNTGWGIFQLMAEGVIDRFYSQFIISLMIDLGPLLFNGEPDLIRTFMRINDPRPIDDPSWMHRELTHPELNRF